MKAFQIPNALKAFAIVAAATVIPSQALPAQTVQAALSREAGILSGKFTGMAQVMAGKYDWKPGEGERSVGDVFNLIVKENGILAETLTGVSSSGKLAPITDPEKLQEALKTSYANLQQTITGLSDADLKARPSSSLARSLPRKAQSGISSRTSTSTSDSRLPTGARMALFRPGRSRRRVCAGHAHSG